MKISVFIKMCLLVLLVLSKAHAKQTQPLAEDALAESKLATSAAIVTKDKFTLSADYLTGLPKSDGFLVLHGCQADRQALRPVADLLAEQGHHVLLLDLRGFGESVSAQYSHDKIKRSTKDMIMYQQKMAQLTAYWEDDVMSAYRFLADKIAKGNSVSILSVGCSAPYAVTTADQMYVANMAFLSPDMDYATKERYKNLRDIPSFFISSVHHIESYQTAEELFEWNGHDRSTMLLYKGNYSGAQLLRRHKSLTIDIAHWLSERAK